MIFEKIYNKENLLRAWQKVRANNGAPGIDRVSLPQFEQKLTENLELLGKELKSGSYRPMPVMVHARKKKGNSQRNIGISTIRDRIVQRSVAQVLSPVFSPHFLPCSYAYLPGRSALTAVNRASTLVKDGFLWVLQIDIENFFDAIDHKILLGIITAKIKEKAVISLIKRLLKARIFREMGLFDNLTGSVQGSGLSPLLSNIYLHPLDKKMWGEYKDGYLRYSDDIIVFSKERNVLEDALNNIAVFLHTLKLQVNPRKTSISHTADGIVYLGYHLDVRGKGPSQKSVTRLEDRLREHFGKIKSSDNVEQKIRDAVSEIRGWLSYYHALTPIRPPNIISLLALARLAIESGESQYAQELVLSSQNFHYKNAQLAFFTGELCSSLGLQNHAMRAYAGALDIDPSFLAARDAIDRVQRSGDDIYESIKRLQLLLHNNPHYREGYLSLAENYQKLGLFGFAQQAYKKAMEIDDDGVDRREYDILEQKISESSIANTDFDYKKIDLEAFRTLFAGRKEMFARQWVDARGRWGFAPVRRPLKLTDIQKHLSGDITIGVFPVTSDDKVGFIVFDIDTPKREIVKKGPGILADMRKKAQKDILQIREACRKSGAELYIEDSGYKGRHGWLFFEEMIPAAMALKVGQKILRVAGKPEDKLVRELFPMGKSDRHKSVIKLPLGINRKNHRRCLFVDDSGVPFPDQDALLHEIKKIDIAKVKQILDDGKASPIRKRREDKNLSKELAHMISGCRILNFLISKAKDTNYLTNFERIVLLYTLTFEKEHGADYLHEVISHCLNYNYAYTQERINKRKEYPISCQKIIEYFPELAESLKCDCSFDLPPGAYPSPVLYLLASEIKAGKTAGIFGAAGEIESDEAVTEETSTQDKKGEKGDDEATTLDFETIFAEEQEFSGNGTEKASQDTVNDENVQNVDIPPMRQERESLDHPDRQGGDRDDPEETKSSGNAEPVPVNAGSEKPYRDRILPLLNAYLELKEKKCDINDELKRITAHIDRSFNHTEGGVIHTKFGRVKRHDESKTIFIIEAD